MAAGRHDPVALAGNCVSTGKPSKWALFVASKQKGKVSKSLNETTGKLAGDNVGVAMIRDLRGVIEREGAGIGVFLTLTEPSKPMVTEATGAGLFELPGFAPVPRVQIATIAQAMDLRDRAVRLPARRDDGFKRASVEDTNPQSRFDL
jgi:hypothetical protein